MQLQTGAAMLGQELFARFQDIMRSKLRFAAGAGIAMIDRLAANEVALFHALGTEGPTFCLKVLGKDETPADGQPPESVPRAIAAWAASTTQRSIRNALI